MFKKTLNFSDLKSDPSIVSELKNEEVVQIFHRGHEVKVMMTQDHYFNLMSKLERLEHSVKSTKYDVDSLMAQFDSKLKKVNEIIGKNLKKTGSN